MNPYEGLTAHDVKHIKEIQNDTDKLLSYINDLILLEHNLDYDKGYEDGLADGYGVGSYVHYSIIDECKMKNHWIM